MQLCRLLEATWFPNCAADLPENGEIIGRYVTCMANFIKSWSNGVVSGSNRVAAHIRKTETECYY